MAGTTSPFSRMEREVKDKSEIMKRHSAEAKRLQQSLRQLGDAPHVRRWFEDVNKASTTIHEQEEALEQKQMEIRELKKRLDDRKEKLTTCITGASGAVNPKVVEGVLQTFDKLDGVLEAVMVKMPDLPLPASMLDQRNKVLAIN